MVHATMRVMHGTTETWDLKEVIRRGESRTFKINITGYRSPFEEAIKGGPLIVRLRYLTEMDEHKKTIAFYYDVSDAKSIRATVESSEANAPPIMSVSLSDVMRCAGLLKDYALLTFYEFDFVAKIIFIVRDHLKKATPGVILEVARLYLKLYASLLKRPATRAGRG